MRLSRHCYDKMWRCPCWAGGGWKFANESRHCGCNCGLSAKWDSRWNVYFAFHRCSDSRCDIVAIPVALQWLSPFYIWWHVARWWNGQRYEREIRRENRR